MAERYFPFNSVSGDREYFAADFAAYFADIISSGVSANGDNLPVTAAGGLGVAVGLGFAWIKGHLYENSTSKPLALSVGTSLPRIDRVIVRLDVAERKIGARVLEGTPAETPTPPELTRNGDFWDICLAEIGVAASAISITDADILDTRTDDEVCGVVRCLVDKIDVGAFMKNCRSEFSTWFANLKYVLDGDVAGHLQNEIDAILADLLVPEIIVDAPEGAVVTCTKGLTKFEETAAGEPIVFKANEYGDWVVSATRGGETSNVETIVVDAVKQYPTAIYFFRSTITVNVDAGSEVVCSDGTTSETKISTGSAVFTLKKPGTYSITATKDGYSAEDTVEITQSGQSVTITLSYVHIYGVTWDGSSTTELTRTDDSALFADPAPAVGTGAGSSPFDNLLPWSGMTKLVDGNNTLVAIPKFWVKVTAAPFKVQIADKPAEGFTVSPAHRDRGDGVGERDVVYIGRYKCDSQYLSRTGQAPKVSTALAGFRSGIKAIGAGYYQADYALQLTLFFLYLVEFASWNSQAKIGLGYTDSNNSAAIKTGSTDSMTYHTGRAAGTNGKTDIQYRWIEGIWGNVREWRDGIIFSDANICTYNNPEKFSDSYNGTGATVKGPKRTTTSGYISAWGVDAADPAFIYPSAAAGSETTYCPDYCYSYTGVRALDVGGHWNVGAHAGLFCLLGDSTPDYTYTTLGSRLQKLPRAA